MVEVHLIEMSAHGAQDTRDVRLLPLRQLIPEPVPLQLAQHQILSALDADARSTGQPDVTHVGTPEFLSTERPRSDQEEVHLERSVEGDGIE